MEDELSSSSASSSSSSRPSSSSSQNRNVEMMEEQNENSPAGKGMGHHPGRLLRIKNGTEGEAIRRPFRRMSICGSSSEKSISTTTTSSSLSSAERNCRKKSFLQKQRSTSALGGNGGGGGTVGGKRIKCVLIGDSKIGKSALVQGFINGKTIPNNPKYVPTTEDIHIYHKINDTSEEKNVKGQEKQKKKKNDEDILLQICDTGGQEEMDRLRPLCYGQTQMVIICFSVMNPTSFTNVTLKWLPEVKRHCMVTEDPENPLKLLLVGTQSDLRSNVNMLINMLDDGLAPISETQALRLASKIGALKYVETSSVTGNNVNHIFDLAMTYGEGKVLPKQLNGLEMDKGFQGKILPNLTERKLLFWRKWRVRQKNKSSNKMKRLVLLPCLF